MRLGIFRDIAAFVTAVQALAVEIFDNSEYETPWFMETMAKEKYFPQLAKAMRGLERSLGRYEFAPTLSNIEDLLDETQGVLDELDPDKNDFSAPGDPYAPDAIRSERPDLASHLEAVRAAIEVVRISGRAA